VEPAAAVPVQRRGGGLQALLATLVARPVDELRAVDLAVTAARILLREQFDDLLCLALLHEVRRLPYQVETVTRVLRSFHGRAMLSDEVGLGKTIEAGMIVLEYLARGMARHILVLVPAALVGQWQEELAEKFGVRAWTTTEEIFRLDPERAWAMGEDEQGRRVVVASLHLARTQRHAPHAVAQGWDMVVVDEAHHIKNRSTAGYRLVDTLRSRFLLLLTATPVENSLEELYNLVTLLRPGQLSTWSAFRQQYVDRDDPFSPRNRERLRELLGEVMIRNTRALAGKGIELPPRFARTLVVEPGEAEVALYEQVVQAVRAMREAPGSSLGLRILLEQAGSSPQAALAGATARGAGDAEEQRWVASIADAARRAVGDGPRKIARLIELLKSLPAIAGEGSKAVVFTRFRPTLEALSEALAGAAIPFSCFAGGMSGPDKDAAVEQLRHGLDVMLCTEVGGEGRNLQFANVLINFDLPWNPMKIEQRIGRLHRIGQTREVHVFSLCARGSAEDRILDVLERRIHLFELVVGEVDMIMGPATEEKEFEQRIFDIYAATTTDDQVEQGFDQLANELEAARSKYDNVKALDEALFGRDYES